MLTVRNPQQTQLFDEWDRVVPIRTKAKWLGSWEGVFRSVVLELMPVSELSKHFHESLGRPSQELYSMAGLVFLAEFNDWTLVEAVTAYESHLNVRFALGLSPGVSSLSQRTLERYRKHLVEDDTAMAVFTAVTKSLAELMGIEVEKQRLDSTHIFSNMATFGRTQLMGVTIKRFLAQVSRHAEEDYMDLPEELRKRYAPPRNKLFGKTGKDEESRSLLRQQVAEDMQYLVNRFQDHESHGKRDTYKQMARVFSEQCEVVEDKVAIKKKPGGATLQNPSDPDATYDGKKGAGYQVQLSETCSEENEQQLITAVIPQTAVDSDMNALPQVLDQLEENELKATEVLGDSHYGTDDNVIAAKKRGVEVVSPVKKGPEKSIPEPGELSVADFEFDENEQQVLHCPEGHAPVHSEYDADKNRTETFMEATVCEQCPRADKCPVKKTRNSKGYYRLYSEPRNVRITRRRIHEQTDAFKDRYRIRAGIEGTNRGIKLRTGMGRLRVRGKPRVFFSIIGKVTGWNILRAAACSKVKEIVKQKLESRLQPAVSAAFCAYSRPRLASAATSADLGQPGVAKTEFKAAA